MTPSGSRFLSTLTHTHDYKNIVSNIQILFDRENKPKSSLCTKAYK